MVEAGDGAALAVVVLAVAALVQVVGALEEEGPEAVVQAVQAVGGRVEAARMGAAAHPAVVAGDPAEAAPAVVAAAVLADKYPF